MNVRTGTGLFKNFIKVCVPIIALAVACSSKADAHFNPEDRVGAAVTISCPDPGICSCVIPQGTQGTVLCYDAEDAEYPGGYPYFVHWDNGCNPYHDVDEGEFVDYCAESDDWGVWMASDEIIQSLAIPIPANCQSFTYSSATSSVLSTDPSQAKPMGLGPVAEGGGALNITIQINQFSGPVDIYFGLYSPEIDPDNIYLLTSGGAFQKLSESLAPWKANITGPIDESLFGDIQTSNLPKGTYYLYLLVTSTGNLSNYYLWITNFSMEQLSGSAGNWTGRYGSGRFGLSFVVDNNKNIDDFTFTINLNGTCGSDIPFENENSDFLGSDVITVEPDGTFEFKAGGCDVMNDVCTNIIVTGVFTDDSHASGTFTDISYFKRDSSCFGSFLYDINWEAAKDCSLLPDEGVSATRFCH